MLFKKTDHTDLCIRTTDGAELWHSTYMLSVFSPQIARQIVAGVLRVDESRMVTENLLNCIEERVPAVNEVTYRTLKLARSLGFYAVETALRKKLMHEPTLEFLKAERTAADYPRALRAFLTGKGDAPDMMGDIVREYREIYEVLQVIKTNNQRKESGTQPAFVRTIEVYMDKYKTKK